MKENKQKIAYTVHPVPVELKQELTGKGYIILDARFAGEGDKIFNKPVDPVDNKAAK